MSAISNAARGRVAPWLPAAIRQVPDGLSINLPQFHCHGFASISGFYDFSNFFKRLCELGGCEFGADE